MQTRSRTTQHVFLACLDCNLLGPPISYQRNTSGGPTDAKTDFFLKEHVGHEVTRMERRDMKISTEQRRWQRHAATTFAATDGRRLFLAIEGTVDTHGQAQYRLRPATLQAKDPKLAVDEETIRRGLVSALFPYRLRSTKFRRFMAALQDIVARLSESQLDLVFEGADDPGSAIARMPDCAYAELERLTSKLFDPWESPRIEQFLNRDRAQESLLSLRVQREITALDA